MKKALSGLFVLLLAVSLCACSPSATNVGTGSQQETETSAADNAPAGPSLEEIDALVQGEWSIEGGSFFFDKGNVTLLSQGQMLAGTYEILMEDSTIIGHFPVSDGTVKITIPYTYENGELTLYNNKNQKMEKQ